VTRECKILARSFEFVMRRPLKGSAFKEKKCDKLKYTFAPFLLVLFNIDLSKII